MIEFSSVWLNSELPLNCVYIKFSQFHLLMDCFQHRISMATWFTWYLAEQSIQMTVKWEIELHFLTAELCDVKPLTMKVNHVWLRFTQDLISSTWIIDIMRFRLQTFSRQASSALSLSVTLNQNWIYQTSWNAIFECFKPPRVSLSWSCSLDTHRRWARLRSTPATSINYLLSDASCRTATINWAPQARSRRKQTRNSICWQLRESSSDCARQLD